MSEHVFVSAVLVAQNGKAEALHEAIAEVVVPTRKEEGCIQYAPHRCVTDDHRFLFFEEWTSQAHLDAHLASAHLAAFRERVGGLLAGAPEVLVWRQC